MGRKKKTIFNPEFCIDKKLRVITPNISAEDMRELEKEILSRKKDPVVVIWDNTILAGFYEYEICQSHGIQACIKTLPCYNLQEAIEWACAYMLHSSTYGNEAYRKYWIGLRFLSGKPNKRIKYISIEEYDTYDHILNLTRQNKTAVKISQELQISSGVVQKYGMYAKAIASIMAKNPILAANILEERIHVSQTNILLLEQLSAEEMRRVTYKFDLGGAKINGFSSEPHSPPVNKAIMQPGIKAMPEYDPDAELAALLLTAKSWTGSLERTYRVANFTASSKEIKQQLHAALFSLKESVEIFCLSLEDSA